MAKNAFVQSMKTIAESTIHNAGFDKTRSGKVVGKNTLTNTYSVKIDGHVYNNVHVTNDATYNIGDTVKVNMPCNQPSQMIIVSSIFSDVSLGKKIGHAQSLIDAMDEQLEDVKEIDGHIYQLNINSNYTAANSTHTGQILKDGVDVTSATYYNNFRWYLMKSTGKVQITSGISNATLTMQIADYMYGMALILEWIDGNGGTLLRKQIVLFDNNVVKEKITQVENTATEAKTIADNTDQYFWHTTSGTDTGTHITQVQKDTFTTMPDGYNLLARSNGIAVRNALDEMAIFKDDGVYFNGYVSGQWQQIAAYTTTYAQIGSTASGKNNIRADANGLYMRNGANTLAQFSTSGMYIYTSGNYSNSVAYFGSTSRIGYANSMHLDLASSYLKMGVDTNNYIYLTSKELQFIKDGVDIGELTYNYYTDNPNLYGINIQLNRSTNTKKPAYAGITARNANGGLDMIWTYVQDNATMSNFNSGALNAGTNIYMNSWEIRELGKAIFSNNNYINTWESTLSETGLYFSGVVSTEGRLLVGNTTYNSTKYTLTVAGTGYFNSTVTTYGIVNVDNIGGSSFANGLQSYFNSYKSRIPRNCLQSHYASTYGNGSLCMGYFLSGYDSNPYGGFFVCHYNTPRYVGIQNGTYTEHIILTNQNWSGTITKSALGLGNVDNKSSATIRSEITRSNVTSALGGAPMHYTSIEPRTASFTIPATGNNAHKFESYIGISSSGKSPKGIVGWSFGGGNATFMNLFKAYVNQSEGRLYYGVRDLSGSSSNLTGMSIVFYVSYDVYL